MPLASVLMLFILLFFSGPTRADSTQYFKNLFYDGYGLTLEERILGRSCYSLRSSPLGASCNPAHLAKDQKSQLRLNFTADQSIGDVTEMQGHLRDDNPTELIRSLSKNRGVPTSSSFSSSVWYQSEYNWLVSYTPLRGGVASFVRNPTLSEITAHVLTESELSLKGGFYFANEPKLQVGAQLRYVESRYLRHQFLLIDALADPSMLDTRTTKALYIDPGISYSFDNSWGSEVSLVVTNMRAHFSGDEIAHKPSLEVGYASQTQFWDKTFRQSVHITTRPDIYELRDRFRWAGIYEAFSSGAFSASFSGNDYALGFLGRWDSLTYGIGAQSEVLTLDRQALERNSQVIGEIGLTF